MNLQTCLEKLQYVSVLNFATVAQDCITKGKPYQIAQNHCLHCGNCMEHCPARAVVSKVG